MKLRDYQLNAKMKVLQRWNRRWFPTRRSLIIADTGSGKTVILFGIYADDQFNVTNPRGLFIADTRKIIRQTYDRAKSFPLFPPVGLIGDGSRQYNKRFTCATVQSLDKLDGMSRYLANGKPTHLLVDEAHLSRNNGMYSRVIKRIVKANHKVRIIFVTATVEPFHNLRHYYPGQPIKVRVPKQYLAKPIHRHLKAYNYPHLFRQWRKRAGSRRTLIFTRSVAEAKRIAEVFGKEGIRSYAVHANTSSKDRAFIERTAQVICTCGVYTKGADLKEIGCIVLLKRERTQTAFIQKVGRGKRPDTKDFIVLNFSGIAHSFVTSGSLR
jgi:superfamily II DNA or RNA helicase